MPLTVTTGSGQEQGQAFDGDLSASAIPVGAAGAGSLSSTPHFGVTSNGVIGANGDNVNGGSNVNMFANPAAVYAQYRPFILGVDGRTGERGYSAWTGQMRWNLWTWDLPKTPGSPKGSGCNCSCRRSTS